MHYSIILAIRLLEKKLFSFITHWNPGKEIISLKGFSIVCDTQAKAEYICINVLPPLLSVSSMAKLSFVALHVRKNVKQMLFLSAAPPNSCYTPPSLD